MITSLLLFYYVRYGLALRKAVFMFFLLHSIVCVVAAVLLLFMAVASFTRIFCFLHCRMARFVILGASHIKVIKQWFFPLFCHRSYIQCLLRHFLLQLRNGYTMRVRYGYRVVSIVGKTEV